MLQESPSLHKSPRHIILVITEMKVIICNKNYTTSISLLLSRVEPQSG